MQELSDYEQFFEVVLALWENYYICKRDLILMSFYAG